MKRPRQLLVAMLASSLVIGGVVAASAAHFTNIELACGSVVDSSSCSELTALYNPTVVPFPQEEVAPKIVFLANGRVPADALAAGPIAAFVGSPIYTTEANTLAAPALNAIRNEAPDLVIVLGGPVAISDTVVQQLATGTGLSIVPTATGAVTQSTRGIARVAGETRFDTAEAVGKLLQVFLPASLPLDQIAFAAQLAVNAAYAEEAGHALTADSAETAETADSVTDRVVYNLQLDFEETVEIATFGNLTLSAVCDTFTDDNGFDPAIEADRLRIVASTTVDGAYITGYGGDGPFAPDNTLDTDTLIDERTLFTHQTNFSRDEFGDQNPSGTTVVDTSIDGGSAVAANLDTMSIDGEKQVLGLNHPLGDCIAIGTIDLIPGPIEP